MRYIVVSDPVPSGPREYYAGNGRWVAERNNARPFDGEKASIVAENQQAATSRLVVFVPAFEVS